MTESKVSIGKVLVMLIAGATAFVAACLTIFVENSNDEAIIILFYPLAPGLIAGLLITGGHGGTDTEEIASKILAPIVNAAFYAILVLGAAAIWRSFMARPDAYRQNPK